MGALAKYRQLMRPLAGALTRLTARRGRSVLIDEIAQLRQRIDRLEGAKATAERANAAKSEFLAKMSQEMRTPLDALASYSEQLLRMAELEGRDDAVIELRKIRVAGEKARGMVNDILEVSRIEKTARTWAQVLHADEREPVVTAVAVHRGPSADEQAFLDEIDAETSVPDVAPEAADEFADDGRERMLVVDDDRNFLELAERLLRREGYAPVCTDAPQSALQIARTVRPTAIFLDVLMPGFDGWDVLAALKADATTTGIPVFMISTLLERSKALTAGADGVVSKPLDMARIKAAIAGLKAVRGTSLAAGR